MSDFTDTIAKLEASRVCIVAKELSKLFVPEASRRDVVLIWKQDDLMGVVADRAGYSVFADGRRQRHAHSGPHGMHVSPLTNLQRATA
jgi:hypothetical protein